MNVRRRQLARGYTAWAVLTSDGIIVIDPIFDYCGNPHPYVIGSAAVGRSLTVADECAQAGLRCLGS